MISRIPAAVGLVILASSAANAQSIGGNASISATGTSSNVALPASTSAYPSAIIAPAYAAATEVFYALGGSTVAAVATSGATQSPALPTGGICLNLGPNGYIAAITGGTAATVRITQLSTCASFSGGSGGSGGGGGGSVTQGTVPWVDTMASWGSTPVSLGGASGWGTPPTGNVVGVNADVLSSVLPTGASTSANQANPQRWIAGNGYGTTWTAVFGTEFNSLPNTDAIESSIVVANSTALDTYMEISAAFGSITTTSGAPYVGFYLCPLNQDGTTYCDGRFASAAVGPPSSSYYLCSIALIPSVTQVQEGSCGTLQPIPPGNFILVAYNLSGATIASSGNAIKAQTYNPAYH